MPSAQESLGLSNDEYERINRAMSNDTYRQAVRGLVFDLCIQSGKAVDLDALALIVDKTIDAVIGTAHSFHATEYDLPSHTQFYRRPDAPASRREFWATHSRRSICATCGDQGTVAYPVLRRSDGFYRHAACGAPEPWRDPDDMDDDDTPDDDELFNGGALDDDGDYDE